MTLQGKTLSLVGLLGVGALMQAAMLLAAQAQGQMNMICSAPQPICDAVVKEFSTQGGINVSMVRLSTGEAYAKLRAEARNPKTDFWFSGGHDSHYQAAEENLLQPYQSPNIANLIPMAQKMAKETGYRSVPNTLGMLGFSYNTQLVKEKNLPIPTSWADLLKPEYRQEIAFSNPNSAGTAYILLSTLTHLMGEDEAFDYMKKLNDNIANYGRSGAGATGQVARGEAAIAITMTHDAKALARQGFPIEISHPREGTGWSLDGTAIVNGARNMEEAKKFMDWILTPQAQAINIRNGFSAYPTAIGTQISKDVVDIEGITLLDIDPKIYGSTTMRQHLLARWDREIGAIAGR